jgi:hypothetical protein
LFAFFSNDRKSKSNCAGRLKDGMNVLIICYNNYTFYQFYFQPSNPPEDMDAD